MGKEEKQAYSGRHKHKFGLGQNNFVMLFKVDMSSRQLGKGLEFRNEVWVSHIHFGMIGIEMV